MKAGFSRIEITPSLGCSLAGDYNKHHAEGFITGLYANAVAFSDGETTVCTVSLDLLEMPKYNMDKFRKYIADRTGLPYDALYIQCIHTHLGPDVGGFLFEIDQSYFNVLCGKVSDAVTLALRDMKDAKAYISRTTAEGISAIRRYRMKDGTIKMNPGASPDALEPIGTPDHTVQLVRITREGASDIAIVNFQTHPDVISGDPNCYNLVCHDWPGFTRKYLEAALSDVADGKGVNAIVFNGTQGDTNQITDRFNARKQMGLEHSKFMGRKLAGAVMSIYTYGDEVNSEKVFYGYKPTYATPKRQKQQRSLRKQREYTTSSRNAKASEKERNSSAKTHLREPRRLSSTSDLKTHPINTSSVSVRSASETWYSSDSQASLSPR